MQYENRRVGGHRPSRSKADLDGNLLSGSLWTNRWNAENRLVQVESATGLAANKRMREVWTHLPDGRWIERIVSTNNGSAYYPAFTNRFVWDGQVLMAVLDHTNGLVMSFVRGLDLSGSVQGAGGVGGVLAVSFAASTLNPQPSTHVVCYDGNGNVVALADASTGSSSGQFEYGPFSEAIRVTGIAAQMMPLRFSTMYEDSVTGDRKYLFRDLDPSTGRWKSRDPIEENGGESLYGFLGNCSQQAIDPDGRFLLAVDGSDSINDRYNSATRRWNSSVHNFYADYSGPGRKIVLQGPRTLGSDVPQIVSAAYHAVCSVATKNPSEVINMVGHSRGGLIVILVAERLKNSACPCMTSVNVNFMGLYDAVDRARAGSAKVIPDNVDYVAHARRDPKAHSRWYFGNTGTSGGKNYTQRFFWGTHAAIGGDPWGGDHPDNVTQAQDQLAAAQSDQWIRTQARSHGVQLR